MNIYLQVWVGPANVGTVLSPQDDINILKKSLLLLLECEEKRCSIRNKPVENVEWNPVKANLEGPSYGTNNLEWVIICDYVY